MNRLYIAGAAGLVLLTGGCASDQASSRADSAVMLSTTGHADPAASRLSNQGQIASVWGDTHTSTLLFEQAVAADPSPLNKFNLAGAYQNEGRQGSALLLYDQVAKEGKASEATTLSPADHRDQRNVRFNLAAAAQDRAAITLGRLGAVRRYLPWITGSPHECLTRMASTTLPARPKACTASPEGGHWPGGRPSAQRPRRT